jgi:glycosidase
MTPARLRTAAALMVLLQGTPILYYGQEIGMRGRIDPGTTTDAAQIPVREAFRWTATVDGPNAAIWYRRPGLRYWEDRYARDHDGVSVAEQAGTPGSLLETYRALLTLRQGHAVLRQGQQRLVDGPRGVLVVERRLGDARMLIVANLTAAPVRYPAPGPDLLGGQDGTVAPWSTALFDAAR